MPDIAKEHDLKMKKVANNSKSQLLSTNSKGSNRDDNSEVALSPKSSDSNSKIKVGYIGILINTSGIFPNAKWKEYPCELRSSTLNIYKNAETRDILTEIKLKFVFAYSEYIKQRRAIVIIDQKGHKNFLIGTDESETLTWLSLIRYNIQILNKDEELHHDNCRVIRCGWLKSRGINLDWTPIFLALTEKYLLFCEAAPTRNLVNHVKIKADLHSMIVRKLEPEEVQDPSKPDCLLVTLPDKVIFLSCESNVEYTHWKEAIQSQILAKVRTAKEFRFPGKYQNNRVDLLINLVTGISILDGGKPLWNMPFKSIKSIYVSGRECHIDFGHFKVGQYKEAADDKAVKKEASIGKESSRKKSSSMSSGVEIITLGEHANAAFLTVENMITAKTKEQ